MSGWNDIPVAGSSKTPNAWDAIPVAGSSQAPAPIAGALGGMPQPMPDPNAPVPAKPKTKVQQAISYLANYLTDMGNGKVPVVYAGGHALSGNREADQNASQIIGTEVTAPLQQAARVYSHVAPDALGAQAAKDVVNRIQANKAKIISEDKSGLASNLSELADLSTQLALAGGLGLPGALERGTAPFLVKGAGALPSIYRAAQTGIAGGGAYAALHALSTPKGQDTTESLPEFVGQGAQQTLKETAQGMAAGGLLSGGTMAIPGVIGGISKGAKVIANTPAVAEMMDKLGAKLGGKSPGVALQDAADKVYNSAWDKFKTAISPVDAEAGEQGINYTGVVDHLKEALGLSGKRSPVPMPDERKKVLTTLLANLEDAQKVDGTVDGSFAGGIDLVKWLGGEQRRLERIHGDTEARKMLGGVRESILDAMDNSAPALSKLYKNARTIFASDVAPLFDKSEGGHFLTQIRDSPTPGDLLASGNQGSLARMLPEKAAIVARGSSADPMLYSYLDAAVNQAKGNPGSFLTSISKAMPAIEKIADPETLAAFKGLEKVASTAKFTGWLTNMGVAAVSPTAGAAAIGLHFKPAYSAPGLIWKLLQNPGTRSIFKLAAKLPEGSKELEILASSLSKYAGATAGNTQKPATTPETTQETPQ